LQNLPKLVQSHQIPQEAALFFVSLFSALQFYRLERESAKEKKKKKKKKGSDIL
jgi:hypothetical protein